MTPSGRRSADTAWTALAPAIVRQPDQLESLRAVRCPTLVIVGEQDEVFLDASKAMAAVIPGASLVIVPDVGHSPQFENPAVWYAAVDGFLATHAEAA